ncbi:MAG: hypothetical protein AB4038_12020 [Prochloraceae cyanobacterium]
MLESDFNHKTFESAKYQGFLSLISDRFFQPSVVLSDRSVLTPHRPGARFFYLTRTTLQLTVNTARGAKEYYPIVFDL